MRMHPAASFREPSRPPTERQADAPSKTSLQHPAALGSRIGFRTDDQFHIASGLASPLERQATTAVQPDTMLQLRAEQEMPGKLAPRAEAAVTATKRSGETDAHAMRHPQAPGHRSAHQ
jgi:hypothetical protein